MGEILQATCSNCSYHAELFIGGGMGDCNPETAIASANYDEHLAAALKENARFRIERKAAVCSKCKKLAVAIKVEYYKADAPKQSIKNACPGCGGALLPLAPDATDILCPNCGKTVKLILAGHWD